VPNFISPEEESNLLKEIEKNEWSNELKRRVQHYGWKYDYTARKIDPSLKIGPLPPFCSPLIQRMKDQDILQEDPDQLIINGTIFLFIKGDIAEYLPGQGISAHVDKKNWFHERIVSITLGSSCIMQFKELKTKKVCFNRISLLIP
jgi:alkylated DNA repair dioxygenase AlkB